MGLSGMGGGVGRGASGYTGDYSGSDADNYAISPKHLKQVLGSTPSTGVYWFANPGYNDSTPFQALADWSVVTDGVLIFSGNNIGNNATRSWAEWGTASTANSGSIGYRSTFRIDAANILANWTGDTNSRFMVGMTEQNGSNLNASGKRWFIMNVSPSTGKEMFDGAPGTGAYTGSVTGSSSGNPGNFYWSTSHGNSIYQMTGNSDTVNSDLWMENRTGGSDGNHSPVVWGDSVGQYYIVNAPFSNRWMFMGFIPNNTP